MRCRKANAVSPEAKKRKLGNENPEPNRRAFQRHPNCSQEARPSRENSSLPRRWSVAHGRKKGSGVFCQQNSSRL